MAEEGYRIPDNSLPNPVDAYGVGAAVIEAWFLPMRITAAFLDSYPGFRIPSETKRNHGPHKPEFGYSADTLMKNSAAAYRRWFDMLNGTAAANVLENVRMLANMPKSGGGLHRDD